MPTTRISEIVREFTKRPNAPYLILDVTTGASGKVYGHEPLPAEFFKTHVVLDLGSSIDDHVDYYGAAKQVLDEVLPKHPGLQSGFYALTRDQYTNLRDLLRNRPDTRIKRGSGAQTSYEASAWPNQLEQLLQDLVRVLA